MYVYHAEVLPSLANARAPVAVERLERRTVMTVHIEIALSPPQRCV